MHFQTHSSGSKGKEKEDKEDQIILLYTDVIPTKSTQLLCTGAKLVLMNKEASYQLERSNSTIEKLPTLLALFPQSLEIFEVSGFF